MEISGQFTPHIVGLEKAVSSGTTRPHRYFGTVANPVAIMTAEHDAAGNLMAEQRRVPATQQFE